MEIALTGGRSASSVVRIGDLVHRSAGPNAAFTQALLKHLEQVKFPYTPKYKGVDDQGRVKLTFIPGKTPLGVAFDEAQLISCVKLLRTFHDFAALSNLCGEHETICHHDFAPWNVLFDSDSPVGIIDFDEAQPGARITDLAYFLWTFLELGTSEETAPQQIGKIAMLCKAYGLTHPQALVPAILQEQERILNFRKEKALNDPNRDERVFSAGAVERIKKEINWIKHHSQAIEDTL